MCPLEVFEIPRQDPTCCYYQSQHVISSFYPLCRKNGAPSLRSLNRVLPLKINIDAHRQFQIPSPSPFLWMILQT